MAKTRRRAKGPSAFPCREQSTATALQKAIAAV